MKQLFHKLFGKENIAIFPNPTTKGKVINLMIEKGEYAVQLVDDKSESIYEKELLVTNKNEVNLFNIPKNIDNGIYYIKVINKNNQQTYKSILRVV